MTNSALLRPAQASVIAANAAEAVRALNEATHPRDGYAGLGDTTSAYEVLGELTMAAERLEQSLGQVCGFLHREAQAGRMNLPSGDPVAALATVGDLLDASAAAAARLARLIGEAQLATEQLRPRALGPG